MMLTLLPFVSEVLRIVIACAIGVLLFRACRFITAQSYAAGMIVSMGIILRAAVGLCLFWISYLNLPILRSLHLGDGFWGLMGDARGYYRYAITAVEDGMHTITPGFSSPLFTKTLALWMHVVGVSPADGLMLNVCLYTGLAVLITRVFKPQNDWRADLPYLAALGAFFFSPVLLIHGTQTLKEDLFNTLIGLLCISTVYLARPLVYGKNGRVSLVGWLLMVSATTFYIAGIRAYYAAIIWAVMACVLTVFLFHQRAARILRYSAAALCLLATMWMAYAYGAGPYYRGPAIGDVVQPDKVPLIQRLVAMVEQARTGFWLTGGATNLTTIATRTKTGGRAHAPSTMGAAEPEGESELGATLTGTLSAERRIALMFVGLGVVFVPISVLKAIGVVEFSGGRGLLPFADFDTIFMDITLGAILALLWSRRRAIGDRLPFVAFALLLFVLTATLLGYVVTNFGTLFRMRTIVAVPVWMVVLALSNPTKTEK